MCRSGVRAKVCLSACLVAYPFLKVLQFLKTDMPFVCSLTSYGWLIKNLFSWY